MQSNPTQVLSETQISSFFERGMLRVDFGFDAAFLDAIVDRVEPLYDQSVQLKRHHGARVQDAWKTVEEVRQLAVHSTIYAALEQIFGRRPRPFQTLNFPIGTSQLPHSDTLHFNSIPQGYLAGVWIALEDIGLENGPLIYYPCSHKLAELSMQDLGLNARREDYQKYEQRIQLLISEQQLTAEYGMLKKGEAIIWHANLLHGGAPQQDPERTRHSQVIHYFFEGCKYYTPMLSGRYTRYYRKPQWIPETPDFEIPDNKGRAHPGILRRIMMKLGLGNF